MRPSDWCSRWGNHISLALENQQEFFVYHLFVVVSRVNLDPAKQAVVEAYNGNK